ncbi:glucosidase II beta subunit-like protein-domain-containing protein [Usnea florida]
MKRRLLWLAAASSAYGSPHVFSVTDDLLAYPQYEVIFSDTFISNKEAESRIAEAASRSSPTAQITSTASEHANPEPAVELSQRLSDPSSSESDSTTPVDTYERMILHNKPYLCSIPSVSPPSTNSTTQARAASEETAELARATDRGYDLLRSMSGSCLYFISGWWSYSFCYNAHVKQFHQLPPGKNTPIFPPVEDPATPSYVLGKFGEVKNRFEEADRVDDTRDAGLPPREGEEGMTTEIQAKGSSSSRYLSQKLSGGTTCDLTGSPRRVEIQFHCHPQSADRIGWIKEVSTCSYLMVVYTPRLCNDVAFLPPREEKAEGIVCREVVRDEDVSEWEQRKKGEAQRKLVGETAATVEGSGRPVVGGIEVGGMKLVGREGKRLDPPQNIQPGGGSHGHGMHGANNNNNNNNDQDRSDVNVIQLITREPHDQGGKVKRLSDKDLKKLGLDPAVVEAARSELEIVAKGKGWRLEVFETVDGGRELRGVVDGEDEDEGEGDGDGEEGSVEEYRDEL